MTVIDGVDVHFLHVRSPHPDALPLIMTHGWPGSVVELLETVGPLTDPTSFGGRAEDAFDLVLPSLPGYGFSAEPAELGWDLGRTARAWAELMRRLGYERYVAQGGDVGAGVTDAMGRQAPEGLLGIHTNLLVTALGGPQPTDTEPERAAAAAIGTFSRTGNGYFVEQATRPQTIGYALLDSPVALAAWMLDHDTDAYYKISRAVVDGQPSGNLTREHVLDNVTLYWLTGTGASAARSYWEAYGADAPAAAAAVGQVPPEVTVPAAFTTFPGEIWRTPRSWAEKAYPTLDVLQRGRPGRPLRRLGGAAAVRDGGPGRVPLAAQAADPRTAAMTTGLTLRTEGRMPAFDGATGWLNSEPLTPEALRGRVVLVQFWTYTCINWLRTLPYVRAWAGAYADHGLVVVGVHTPEFSFERDVENVRDAVAAMRIPYPVALDSGYAVWEAFANHYWPALYFVDATGRIRHHVFGEGDYDRSEQVIRQLLDEAGFDTAGRPLVAVVAEGVEAPADWDDVATGETYLRLSPGRRLRLARAAGARQPRVQHPDAVAPQPLGLSGNWSVGSEAVVLDGPGGRIAFSFHARDVNLVMGPVARGGSARFRVRLDGGPPGDAHGVDVDERGQRRTHRSAAPPADPAAAAGRRSSVRDRVRRSRRAGDRLHLRLARPRRPAARGRRAAVACRFSSRATSRSGVRRSGPTGTLSDDRLDGGLVGGALGQPGQPHLLGLRQRPPG